MTARTRSRPFVVALAAMLAVLPAGACTSEPDSERPAAPTAAPAGAFSLADDFNDATVEAAPPGWAGGEGATVAAFPDAVDRSLRIGRAAQAPARRTSREFPPATGVVEVQARVQVRDWSADYDALEVASARGLVAAGIGISRGRFVDRATGQGFAPADPGRWYALRAVLHTAEQRYDLLLDGRRVLTRSPFASAAADVARVSAGVRAGPGGTLFVDAVTARATPAPTVDYLVFDQFNDDPVGSQPAGHAVTGGKAVSVAAVPSRQDHSLLLSSGKGTAEAKSVRTFAAQTGTVVVQANVRTDEAAGTKLALYVESSRGGTAAAIQFNGGWLAYYDGATAHRLVRAAPREWYTLKLVLDVKAGQFELYVDGSRFTPSPAAGQVDRRWPFREALPGGVDQLTFGIGAGQDGTVRVDNVLVFRPVTSPPGTVLNVREQPYGAIGDGLRDDTAALQRAIDAVPAGGTVYLAGGVFRTGSLRLRSDMTLWINYDAVLLGSPDDAAYTPLRKDEAGTPFAGGLLTRGLVTAAGASRLRIEGGGTIDGNGRTPAWGIEGGTHRPALLALTRGRDVIVRNLHLRDAATWAIVPDEIDGLVVADVTIDSRIYANRDGIDVVDSHGVLIERVAVSTDDDAICFKSYSAKGVDGAVVRLSTVGRSVRANGVKFGTGSVTAFRNVVVEDMLIKHVDKAALEVVAVDGSVVAHLAFRRITADGALRAIFVLLGRRTGPTGTGATPRWVSGLAFEGVVGDHLAEPSVLSGQQLAGTEHKLYHVLLSEVRQKVTGGVRRMPSEPEEYSGIYPESNLWSGPTTPPARGFYLRYVDGLTTRDNSVVTRADDVRPLMTVADTVAVAKG